MVVHSLAWLKHSDPPLLATVASYTTKRMDDFSSQGVSNMVWAFTKLEYFNGDLMKAAINYFEMRPASFRPKETCNLLWALTKT
eukprot:gene12646-15882_t